MSAIDGHRHIVDPPAPGAGEFLTQITDCNENNSGYIYCRPAGDFMAPGRFGRVCSNVQQFVTVASGRIATCCPLANNVGYIDRRCMSPQKCPFPRGVIRAPIYTWFIGPPSYHRKQHVDRLIRFCMAHQCVWHEETQTDHATSVAVVRIFKRCGLTSTLSREWGGEAASSDGLNVRRARVRLGRQNVLAVRRTGAEQHRVERRRRRHHLCVDVVVVVVAAAGDVIVSMTTSSSPCWRHRGRRCSSWWRRGDVARRRCCTSVARSPVKSHAQHRTDKMQVSFNYVIVRLF